MNVSDEQTYESFLKYYISLYNSLVTRKLPNITYSQNQDNLSKFINTCPSFLIDDTMIYKNK